MQLPQSKNRQNYIDQIKIIEANLKDATSGDRNAALLLAVQKRLDTTAEKYQHNEGLGTARYKLYELQALVHHANGNDDDALEFIKQAIETRGATYEKAERIKKQLSLGDSYATKTADPAKMTKEQRRSMKIGLEGWLALFTVGVILSAILYLASMVIWLYNISNLVATADDFAASLLSPYYSYLAFYSAIMGFLAIWLLVLLFKWKRSARWLGIVFLAISIVLVFIDYVWYADLLTQLSGLDPQSGNAGIFWSVIWIIYLCVSKRVKRTLVK